MFHISETLPSPIWRRQSIGLFDCFSWGTNVKFILLFTMWNVVVILYSQTLCLTRNKTRHIVIHVIIYVILGVSSAFTCKLMYVKKITEIFTRGKSRKLISILLSFLSSVHFNKNIFQDLCVRNIWKSFKSAMLVYKATVKNTKTNFQYINHESARNIRYNVIKSNIGNVDIRATFVKYIFSNHFKWLYKIFKHFRKVNPYVESPHACNIIPLSSSLNISTTS